MSVPVAVTFVDRRRAEHSARSVDLSTAGVRARFDDATGAQPGDRVLVSLDLPGSRLHAVGVVSRVLRDPGVWDLAIAFERGVPSDASFEDDQPRASSVRADGRHRVAFVWIDALGAKVVPVPDHDGHRRPEADSVDAALVRSQVARTATAPAFFEAVLRAADGAEELLVAGADDATHDFVQYVAQDRPSVRSHLVGLRSLRLLPDDDVVRLARRYFARLRALEGTDEPLTS